MTDRREHTVLITGANSGLGLATVLHVARLGFRSIGTVRSKAKARLVAEAAEKAEVTVETVLLDVTDAERCAVVVDELRPWAIVNNAGYPGFGAVEDITDDEVRRQLEAMVVAPIRLARLALPYMRNDGGGRIVNISSIYGLTTTPFSGWYQAAKHALEAVSDALRIEVARDGVKVVLIEPGGLKTGIWKELADEATRHGDSNYRTGYERTLVLLRFFNNLMGEPSAVAKVIGRALTSSSPRARYLVGPDARAIVAAQPFIPTELRDRVTRLVSDL